MFVLFFSYFNLVMRIVSSSLIKFSNIWNMSEVCLISDKFQIDIWNVHEIRHISDEFQNVD